MSIIERFGIKPIKVSYTAKILGYEEDVIKKYSVRKLEKQRDEMLEALIYGVLMIESLEEFITIDSKEYSFRNNSIDIIEKVCHPKKWPDVKELLK